jgi:DNA-binding IclR family transcriptional regulator
MQPAARTAKEGGRGSHLHRGLQALELLAVQPGSAADIAARLGVNRSTGLRLLQELESLGYVTRDARTRRYSIVAERFVPMTSGLRHDWQQLINPTLERIRDKVGESTLFATPVNGVMVHVSFYVSSHSIAVREQIGTVRPMHASAIGKAWLSALSDAELELELERIDYGAGTVHAARNAAELRERVLTARRRGWAVDQEETVLGAGCVAAPVWVGETPVGAVAISAPITRLDEATLARYGALLVEAMDAIHQATAGTVH